MMTAGAEQLASKETWWLDAVGRVKSGLPLEQARAELDTIFQSYMNETSMNAEARRESFSRMTCDRQPGLNDFAAAVLSAFAGVDGDCRVGAADRVRERGEPVAGARNSPAQRVRRAAGAGREPLAVAASGVDGKLTAVTLGGLLGLLFARWGSAFLVRFVARGRGQIFVNLPLDYRVLLFTAAVALLTGLMFGLAPALQATRIEPNSALKDSPGTNARAPFALRQRAGCGASRAFTAPAHRRRIVCAHAA
jgi:hypothetical protein